jgi:hypothetical protein
MPPTGIITTVCSGTISLSDMISYAAAAAVFAVCIAVLRMAADLVGGSLGHTLEHLFTAALIVRTVTRPITSAYGFVNRSKNRSSSSAPAGPFKKLSRRSDLGGRT